jgi:hypothetical protein
LVLLLLAINLQSNNKNQQPNDDVVHPGDASIPNEVFNVIASSAPLSSAPLVLLLSAPTAVVPP